MAQRFKSLLGDNQELRPLLAGARALSALQHHFTGVAPPNFARSSQILSLRSGTLSVAVANAAIAAKLRQLAPELVVMLQNRGCEVSGIRVKVQVAFDRGQVKPASRKLSKTAQNALDEFKQNLGDSPLRLALEKMTRQR